MKKIIKFCGHCYDSCGWTICDYYALIERGNVAHRDTIYMCELFNVEKRDSKSLVCCDRIYGKDYEGEA